MTRKNGRKAFHGYIFTNKRHSEKAIMSTILGIISMASMVIVVYLAYRQDGNAPAGYGVTGVLVTLFSVVGLILGTVTLREKDRYRLFPCLGIVFNLLALGGISLILYLGAYL